MSHHWLVCSQIYQRVMSSGGSYTLQQDKGTLLVTFKPPASVIIVQLLDDVSPHREELCCTVYVCFP